MELTKHVWSRNLMRYMNNMYRQLLIRKIKFLRRRILITTLSLKLMLNKKIGKDD